jgi:hypothetical protein
MFEFKLAREKGLINIFKCLGQCFGDVGVTGDEKGVRFTALDQSHIIFFNLEIFEKFFDEYHKTRFSSLFDYITE